MRSGYPEADHVPLCGVCKGGATDFYHPACARFAKVRSAVTAPKARSMQTIDLPRALYGAGIGLRGGLGA
jgi:hypothetical protein